ncbi:MAG: ABC transporter substrate-binding protein [Cyclonatronaceae bacterium]
MMYSYLRASVLSSAISVRLFSAPLVLVLLLAGISGGCGSSPEVIQVEGEARTADRSTPSDADTSAEKAPFRLHIGELKQAYSIDPLYALYPASKRMVSLIYEGLTRLDEDGNVQPALAESWEVSEDSTRYTFTLRENAFFHDDPAFTTGQGRQVRAQDVRFAFTRMTERNVPEEAAELFKPHIKGFEAFSTQRRHAYFENEKIMEHIPGITAVDERTITFELNAPAPEFPELLARPMASVYPEEAFEQSGVQGEARAVGSGPFVFSQVQGDTLVTLERNFDFYDEARVAAGLNSIQFRFFEEEARLFSALSAGDIQLLPQVGPLTSQTVLMTGGDSESPRLAQAYTDQLRLSTHQFATLGIYFKEDNSLDIPYSQLPAVYEALGGDNFMERLPVFSRLMMMEEEPAQTSETQLSGELSIGAYPEAHATFVAARLAMDMNQAEGAEDRNMRVYPLPHPHRDVLLYVAPQAGARSVPGLRTIALVSIPQFSLHRLDAGEIHFNEHPWWISFKDAVREQAAETRYDSDTAQAGD